MGLDMFLIRKKHLGKAKIKVLNNEYEWINNKDEEYENVTDIETEIGYWRKANHIHKWFVENCQDGVDDCGEYYVPKEKLQKLLDICKKIKEGCPLIDGIITNGQTLKDGEWQNNYEDGKVMENKELAEELLPTQSGFFFGSCEYDQYYMEDIDKTIQIIEDALKDESEGIYYTSSW